MGSGDLVPEKVEENVPDYLGLRIPDKLGSLFLKILEA